jgi:hypothetical protein
MKRLAAIVDPSQNLGDQSENPNTLLAAICGTEIALGAGVKEDRTRGALSSYGELTSTSF